MTLRFEGRDGFVVSMLCHQCYSWLPAIAEDLRHIQALNDGWDCGSGRAVKSTCVQTAFSLLNQIMRTDTVAPRISPLPNGGLQLEWQTANMLLQFEIDPLSNINAYFRTEDVDDEFPVSLIDDSKMAPIAERLELAACT
ncbi:MAG TPA: hypothetical protein V6C97_14410 [Oculatellaceae cyanobacterium]